MSIASMSFICLHRGINLEINKIAESITASGSACEKGNNVWIYDIHIYMYIYIEVYDMILTHIICICKCKYDVCISINTYGELV